jgi:hypothetical protein
MDEITPEVGPAQATDYSGAFSMNESPSGWRLFKAFLRRLIVMTGAFRRHRARKRDKAMLKEALRIQRLTDPERARLEYLDAVFASLDRGGIKLAGDHLEVAPTPIRIISDGLARVDLERLVRDEMERERERNG